MDDLKSHPMQRYAKPPYPNYRPYLPKAAE